MTQTQRFLQHRTQLPLSPPTVRLLLSDELSAATTHHCLAQDKERGSATNLSPPQRATSRAHVQPGRQPGRGSAPSRRLNRKALGNFRIHMSLPARAPCPPFLELLPAAAERCPLRRPSSGLIVRRMARSAPEKRATDTRSMPVSCAAVPAPRRCPGPLTTHDTHSALASPGESTSTRQARLAKKSLGLVWLGLGFQFALLSEGSWDSL